MSRKMLPRLDDRKRLAHIEVWSELIPPQPLALHRISLGRRAMLRSLVFRRESSPHLARNLGWR